MSVWSYRGMEAILDWGARMFKNTKLYGERPSFKRINGWI
jgi:hypothetical protein